MRSKDILDVRFDDIDVREAVERALLLMSERRAAYVVTPNPEIVLARRKNKKLAAALNASDLSLPDGVGIVYASRLLGTPIKHRVPGIDFASALMARMSAEGKSVFLFGAKPGVAELAAEQISKRCPGIKIAGTNDGYFTDDTQIIEKINAAAPDFLIACLSSPRQELWMRSRASKLNVGLMAGLGGALDVYADIVERAPQKWQDRGFEWLYRLIKDPRRIKRMIKLPAILLFAVKRRLFGT